MNSASTAVTEWDLKPLPIAGWKPARGIGRKDLAMETGERPRVLVIEDDHQIADFIHQGMTEAGFEVSNAFDGKSGLDLALERAHDLLILDIMLPGMNGMDLLATLREQKVDVPVLILSAKRSVDDRVLGLRAGGDDYLVKPFAFAELMARVESLLRRSQGSKEPVTLSVGGLSLDLLGRRAYRDDGEEIELQPQEFSLLEFLMRNSGNVVTKIQILQNVWGYNFNPSTNIIEVHVCRLREKIDRPDRPKLIKTVRGAGYVLVDPEKM